MLVRFSETTVCGLRPGALRQGQVTEAPVITRAADVLWLVGRVPQMPAAFGKPSEAPLACLTQLMLQDVPRRGFTSLSFVGELPRGH